MKINVIYTRLTPIGCVITYQVPGGHKEFTYNSRGCSSFVKIQALQQLKQTLKNECKQN